MISKWQTSASRLELMAQFVLEPEVETIPRWRRNRRTHGGYPRIHSSISTPPTGRDWRGPWLTLENAGILESHASPQASVIQYLHDWTYAKRPKHGGAKSPPPNMKSLDLAIDRSK